MDWAAAWDWIQANGSSGINLFFAFVVAAAAWGSFRLNRQLVTETESMRRAETDPFVAVYLEQRGNTIDVFDLVIRNVARGSAFDISFRVSPDPPLWKGSAYRLSDVKAISNGIGYMAPGQEIRLLFGTFPELELQPIEVEVSYDGSNEDQLRTTFSGRFVIDVEQFVGMVQIGDDPLDEVSTSLASIARDIKAIRQGDSTAEMSVTVRRHYFFSRYVNRKWRKWFGIPTFGNTHNSLSDLWRAYRKRHGPR